MDRSELDDLKIDTVVIVHYELTSPVEYRLMYLPPLTTFPNQPAGYFNDGSFSAGERNPHRRMYAPNKKHWSMLTTEQMAIATRGRRCEIKEPVTETILPTFAQIGKEQPL